MLKTKCSSALRDLVLLTSPLLVRSWPEIKVPTSSRLDYDRVGSKHNLNSAEVKHLTLSGSRTSRQGSDQDFNFTVAGKRF